MIMFTYFHLLLVMAVLISCHFYYYFWSLWLQPAITVDLYQHPSKPSQSFWHSLSLFSSLSSSLSLYLWLSHFLCYLALNSISCGLSPPHARICPKFLPACHCQVWPVLIINNKITTNNKECGPHLSVMCHEITSFELVQYRLHLIWFDFKWKNNEIQWRMNSK